MDVFLYALVPIIWLVMAALIYGGPCRDRRRTRFRPGRPRLGLRPREAQIIRALGFNADRSRDGVRHGPRYQKDFAYL